MTAAIPAIPHLPFYEELSRLQESSPEWRATSAGLVTLRLVDQWAETRAAGRKLDLLQLAAVEDAIESMEPQDMLRGLLRSIYDTVRSGGSSILPRLMAYAKAQQFRAAWPLAVAVYDSVLSHPEATHQPDLALASACQRGYCLRMAGDLERAERSYDWGRTLAVASNDLAGMLRADLGSSTLALHRGNLPHAERLLDRIIATANEDVAASGRSTVMDDILARALTDRMQVAGRRGQLEDAIVFGHRALEHAVRPSLRDRILGDVGMWLGDMGYRDAARDAHLVLSATAEEQVVRWTAMVNLVELAALDDNEIAFEGYRAQLSRAALPPALAAHFHLFVGEGYRRFARYESARSALGTALKVARSNQVNEVALRAEAALRDLGAKQEVRRSTADAASPEIAEIAEKLSRMREAVAVGS